MCLIELIIEKKGVEWNRQILNESKEMQEERGIMKQVIIVQALRLSSFEMVEFFYRFIRNCELFENLLYEYKHVQVSNSS